MLYKSHGADMTRTTTATTLDRGDWIRNDGYPCRVVTVQRSGTTVEGMTVFGGFVAVRLCADRLVNNRWFRQYVTELFPTDMPVTVVEMDR